MVLVFGFSEPRPFGQRFAILSGNPKRGFELANRDFEISSLKPKERTDAQRACFKSQARPTCCWVLTCAIILATQFRFVGEPSQKGKRALLGDLKKAGCQLKKKDAATLLWHHLDCTFRPRHCSRAAMSNTPSPAQAE